MASEETINRRWRQRQAQREQAVIENGKMLEDMRKFDAHVRLILPVIPMLMAFRMKKGRGR